METPAMKQIPALSLSIIFLMGCAGSPRTITDQSERVDAADFLRRAHDSPAPAVVSSATHIVPPNASAGPAQMQVIPAAHSFESSDNREADRKDEITLEELQELALANNPGIQQARASVSKGTGIHDQVGLKPNPSVGYSADEVGNGGTAGLHSLFLSQTFVTGQKLDWNRQVAAWNVEAAKWEFKSQRQRVLTDLQLQFIAGLAAQQRLELTQKLLDITRRGVEVAERLMNALEGTRPDVLQAEIQVAEVELLHQQAAFDLEAAWNQIRAIAGTSAIPRTRFAGELSLGEGMSDLDSTYERLVSQSPQIRMADTRVQQARADLNRQRSWATPNVMAQFGVGHDDETDNEFANLQVSVPWMVNNQNQGNIKAAHAEYCRATHEAQRLRLVLRANLVAAYRDYQLAHVTAAKYASTILVKATETAELTEQAYAVGEFSFLRVLTARRTQIEASLKHITALAEVAQAEARIDGMLLTGALNTVPDVLGVSGIRSSSFNGQ